MASVFQRIDGFLGRLVFRAIGCVTGLIMLADGNANFARALGLEMDATAYGMGVRSRRFALYAEDGVVRTLNVEAPGEFKVSSAESMLGSLG